MNYALVLGACALVTASGGALTVLRSKMASTKKTKLSIQLDVSDYNKLRIWADRSGQTLSDFARSALMKAIPPEDDRKLDEAGRSGAILDRVFEELDRAETPLNGVFPMPPARKPQKGVVTEADRIHPAQRVNRTALTQVKAAVPPGPHPCVHLQGTAPLHMEGQCQGTCTQVQQRGKPCYWTPTTASSCQQFEPKTEADRKRFVR